MITFKQYLLEARQAPLYHGTSSIAATKILKKSMIELSWAEDEEKPAVSLTRSFKFAKYWADSVSTGNGHPVVFELDQQKLSYNYKIVPHNFFSNLSMAKARYLRDDPVWGQNEYEEKVYKDIKNIERYLLAIHIFERGVNLQLGRHPLIKYKGKFINQ